MVKIEFGPSIIMIVSALYVYSCQAVASDCADVYASATRNIKTNERQASELLYFFNKHCESNGEISSSATGVNFEAVVKAIPMKFGAENSSAQQKLSEFCKIGTSLNTQWENSSSYSSTVIVPSLVNFNECVALQNKGVRITHAIQEPTSVIITGDRTDANLIYIDAATFNNMTCFSASFSSNGNNEPFDGGKKLKVPNTGFNISCQRKEIIESGKKIYPLASVAIGTSEGSYTVVMPDEELYGYDVASANRARFNALMTEKNQLSAELGDKIRNLQTRLDNVSVRPFAFHVADGPTFSNVPFAGDVNAVTPYAASMCNPDGSVPVLQVMTSLAGGGHGITTYAGACLKK
ncbi:hypothetical protein AB7M29_005122 [Pseudomonas sp. F-14 TE3623]